MKSAAPDDSFSDAPQRRQLLAIGGIGFASRAAVYVVVALCFGVSLEAHTDSYDGASFKAYARALLGDRSGLTDYDKRVFPGYPLLIAAVHGMTRLPTSAAAVAITWAAAGLAAAFSAALFGDRRVGCAMIVLIPYTWHNEASAMSEAPMLALALAGLLLANRKRPIAAGLCLGLAGLVRPVACFAAVGGVARIVFETDEDRAKRALTGRESEAPSRSSAVVMTTVAGIVVLAGLGLVYRVTGAPLTGVKVYANDPAAYAGRIFDWPFQRLIAGTLSGGYPAWRVLHAWGHALFAIGGCLLLAVSLLRTQPRDPGVPPRDDRGLAALALCWLGGNTLFALCVGGGVGDWGFTLLPRFLIPGLPPLFWAARRAWPRNPWLWLPIAAACFAWAVWVLRTPMIWPARVR